MNMLTIEFRKQSEQSSKSDMAITTILLVALTCISLI